MHRISRKKNNIKSTPHFILSQRRRYINHIKLRCVDDVKFFSERVTMESKSIVYTLFFFRGVKGEIYKFIKRIFLFVIIIIIFSLVFFNIIFV